jgi:hypothetical protein
LCKIVPCMQGLVQRKILAFALAAAVLTDIGLAIILWPRGFGVDFAVYWRAACALHPYAFSLTPFANPPTALLGIRFLRLLPLWPAYIFTTICGIAAFFFSSRKLYGSAATRLAVFSPALVLGAIPGQLAIIEAALVFLAYASPPITSGVVLAVAASIKPQMVFLAPIALFVRHGWKPTLAFCLSALALAAAATFAFGAMIWSDWLFGMHSLVSVAANRHALLLAVSPLSFLPLVNGFVAFGVLILATVGGLLLYLTRSLPPSEQAGVLVACSLLAAPYALSYDLVALAPLAAAIVLRDQSWRGLAAAGTFTAALGPLSLASAVASLWPRSDRKRDGGRGSKR